MNIVIVKYNAGNIQSVQYALERIGASALVTDDHELIQSADKVIFPGVGEASTAMNYLQSRSLDVLLKGLQQPVLGICLGMQLMCQHSEENDTDCMGIFDEQVKLFQPEKSAGLKVPQIGWNMIRDLSTPLFKDVPENSFCYFVHGYYASKGEHTIATTDYVLPYSAALHRDNFYGVQFHPEKSAVVGEQILKNFLTL
ncbi:MAG: imidazole glycerol phosphate synthase subunit HisH [Sediminibacterium sp. Gen4]|jgi:imidazole glycerol-phosphate synthase subunit HisH|uniref:imidazole glycerol phosphate synthase subunit HisH n=1 Tax=unclassified Sediminibacterium TaxID=2635961 RepID=UPI0015C1AFD2|nr:MULTISPECIES: imidazole glycerol phosphate synthase subunit HisH [unclassified Sediminibacterium]MBW0161495.1 imidazole glycerol phosphate synthase subunit HisH [Sediminibacterium sp.]MBW0163828.1 imidazole glycerol phosphate synthase subunit HisH [Sediminibacterium sp.]NWK66610.1 imidazole glycerol phosphate synthase subunit HisH [Sediminibacterium sp. Gen4]